MAWTHIGQVAFTNVVEIDEPFLTPAKMFAQATPEALAPHLDWLIPRALCPDTGRMILPIQSFVIRTPHHVALVDSCVGNHKSPAGFTRWANRDDGNWLRALAAAGLQPEDIDYVFCTHLHLDHCGWHTRLVDGRWVPTFPRARYIFAREEFAHAEQNSRTTDDPVFRENVLPVMEAGLGVLVDTDFALDDCVYLESTPGHTPGHCAVRMTSRGESGVITGDLIHSPLQCRFPEWNFIFDHNPALAARTRRAFLERHADTGTLVLGSHFPLPSVGWLESLGEVFDYRYREP
ncbi:MAG: MBL fold metallo-hydrolase [Gammaproteobacteria bacterium]|nr:MBL fold metallo-hydrolase [Gammaproteobacteria bacterium]